MAPGLGSGPLVLDTEGWSGPASIRWPHAFQHGLGRLRSAALLLLNDPSAGEFATHPSTCRAESAAEYRSWTPPRLRSP